ncbi:hypothetical protein LVY72_13925 [Arthrobacter sp. I2-34]|uniref:DUF2975 domain-containing protein n=1 Tax=Arthrobacter hankyongi TaxID=2904801 RepID=A0ABS9L8J1_9MICC|nr:hypothetical protein [Arthrobacter hankyongi]MCG2622996.1 hypothetical protein [Arthrobacter hankyongi]
MDKAVWKRRGATTAAITGVTILGGVMIAGSVLPPWPLISNQYFGQNSPIGNFVQAVFEYPIVGPAAWLFVDQEPWYVSVLELAPIILQAIILAVLTFAIARLLAGIPGGDSFAPSVRKSLTLLSVAALAGAIIQFSVGLLAWTICKGWHDANFGPVNDLVYGRPPFPDWPVTLLIIGILAAALRAAFRDGAQLREEVAGIV